MACTCGRCLRPCDVLRISCVSSYPTTSASPMNSLPSVASRPSMSERFVLDASALLCLLKSEQGADRVLSVLPRAMISAVNLSEVYSKLVDAGGSESRIAQAIDGLHLRVEAFD